jgi:FAD/FMN-containing dehydrogenase
MIKTIMFLLAVSIPFTSVADEKNNKRTHAPLSSGSVLVDTGIIDDIDKYNVDIGQCQVLADSITIKGDETASHKKRAFRGAIAGGLLGAAVGGSSGAKYGAGAGAATGVTGGIISKGQSEQEVARALAQEKHTVMSNCLKGRGYAVLN